MKFKRMSEIYSRMVDHTITTTNQINDFSVGSAIRSIYESISIEVEEFYIFTRENMKEAIDEGVYSSFGFKRREAKRAYGTFRIDFHNKTQQDMVISRGSRFSSNSTKYPQIFETRQEYLVPKGSLRADVEAFCTNVGSIGNVPKGKIDVMNSPLANASGAENTQDIQTGEDKEPLDELKSRFRSYIESLSKATLPALEYGTREVEEVTGVYIKEETGYVRVYAHDKNGNLPNSVRKEVEENIEDYRPAGILVEVKPVERKEIDLEIEVVLNDKTATTTRFRDEVRAKVTKYLNNMRTSENLILTDLIRIIMMIDKNLVYDVIIKNEDENIILEGKEVIRAGDVDVKLSYYKK